jgi:TPR repeat protein
MKNEKAAEIKRIKKQIAEVVSKGKITKEYFALLTRLADLGDPDALTDLGSFLHEGYRDKQGRILIRQDEKAAMQCYLLAATMGNTYAMIAVADSLSATRKKDALKEAESLYKLAFKLGDVLGAYNLACTYLDQHKHSEAVRWFKVCLKKGDLSALLPLAYAELYGLGTSRDAKAALDKFRRVARGGRDFCQFDQEEAMMAMAETYRNGWFVPRDFDAAIGWLQRAAKLGSAAAQGLLTDLNMCEEHPHRH